MGTLGEKDRLLGCGSVLVESPRCDRVMSNGWDGRRLTQVTAMKAMANPDH